MKKKTGRPAVPSRHQLTIGITKTQLKGLKRKMLRDDLPSISAVVRKILEGAL